MMKNPVLMALCFTVVVSACQSSPQTNYISDPPPNPVATRVLFEECSFSVEIPWAVDRVTSVSPHGTEVIEYRADQYQTANTRVDSAYFASQCYVTDEISESEVRRTARGLANSSGASDYTVVPLVGPQSQSVYSSSGSGGYRVMQWIAPDNRVVVIYAAQNYADRMFSSIRPI